MQWYKGYDGCNRNKEGDTGYVGCFSLRNIIYHYKACSQKYFFEAEKKCILL